MASAWPSVKVNESYGDQTLDVLIPGFPVYESFQKFAGLLVYAMKVLALSVPTPIYLLFDTGGGRNEAHNNAKPCTLKHYDHVSYPLSREEQIQLT